MKGFIQVVAVMAVTVVQNSIAVAQPFRESNPEISFSYSTIVDEISNAYDVSNGSISNLEEASDCTGRLARYMADLRETLASASDPCVARTEMENELLTMQSCLSDGAMADVTHTMNKYVKSDCGESTTPEGTKTAISTFFTGALKQLAYLYGVSIHAQLVPPKTIALCNQHLEALLAAVEKVPSGDVSGCAEKMEVFPHLEKMAIDGCISLQDISDVTKNLDRRLPGKCGDAED